MSAQILFIVKGGLAVLALVLLLWHMLADLEKMRLAQALRYVALLTAAGTVAFASQEQLREGAPWMPRQWGGLLIAIMVIVASIASLREARRDRLPASRRED